MWPTVVLWILVCEYVFGGKKIYKCNYKNLNKLFSTKWCKNKKKCSRRPLSWISNWCSEHGKNYKRRKCWYFNYVMLLLQLSLNLTLNTVNIFWFLLWDQASVLRVSKIVQRAKNMPVIYHPKEQFGNRATQETLQKKDVKRQFNKGLMCEY